MSSQARARFASGAEVSAGSGIFGCAAGWVQELFVDKHLRDVSPRYDFDSIRVGIQPITARTAAGSVIGGDSTPM